MNVLTLLNSKAVRTIFFIFFVGGLLVLLSAGLSFLWNSYLSDLLSVSTISILEATGIITLGYILYFGIKFGSKKCISEKLSDTHKKNNRKNDYISGLDYNRFIQNLSKKERKFLKELMGKNFEKTSPLNADTSTTAFINNKERINFPFHKN